MELRKTIAWPTPEASGHCVLLTRDRRERSPFYDPVTFGALAAFLVCVAAIASAVPAYRAIRDARYRRGGRTFTRYPPKVMLA
jgi:hypothetical protein